MKINYLQCTDGTKLFSFYGHDYKTYTDKKGNFHMIDGGFEYTRYSLPDNRKASLQEDEISNLIYDIRNSFKWTKRYGKNGRFLRTPITSLLKDLETNHIVGILKNFTEKLIEDQSVTSKQWKAYHLIFIEELLYRSKIKG